MEARPAPLPNPLPPARRLFGREHELAALVPLLLDADPRPVLIHGSPGIGKTALTLATLHHHEIATHFGRRRYFVELDAVTVGEAVLDTVGQSMGEPPGSDRPARALASLAAAPALLVLDNVETPWEAAGQGAATAAALEQLAAVPALRLFASIRGSERPGRVRWRRPDELAPLDEADAAALFLAVTEGEGAGDPVLPILLALLGGLPLAIDLVARRLEEAGSVERLRTDWQRQRTRAASIGSGDDRELSLHASIELSLASPRLTTAGRRLFAMMGHLPDGLAEPDAEALLGPEGATAATGLRRVGLARLEGGRLRMLVPVREHAGSSTQHDPEDPIRLRDHFLGLAHAIRAYFHGVDRNLDLPRHRVELTNIEAVLDRALEHCDPTNSSFRHEVGYLTRLLSGFGVVGPRVTIGAMGG
jgi:hypothetical protein